jgi:hypothetical protein
MSNMCLYHRRKGHVAEEVSGVFVEMYNQYRWKMIPNCTGRYTCRDHALVCTASPMALLQSCRIGKEGDDLSQAKFRQYEFFFSEERKDPIIVVPFESNNETGLITYVKIEEDKEEFARKKDSSAIIQRFKYVHTLNAPSGFRRKLAAIGIEANGEKIFQLK